MEIPHFVFAEFIKWNKPPLNMDVSHDKRFVVALLLALTEEEKLVDGEISQDVMEFVESMFQFNILFY